MEYIKESKNGVLQECLDFEFQDPSIIYGKKKYDIDGKDGLRRKKPVAIFYPNRIQQMPNSFKHCL